MLQKGMKKNGKKAEAEAQCQKVIQKAPVYMKYESHTIKQLTFPKRKGNVQLTIGS